MQPQEIGATEWLANLSVGYIVLAAFVLTIIRLALIPNRAALAQSIAELAESLLIAGVFIFLIVRPFFFQAFYIPSESMEPTLMGHDEGESKTGVLYHNSVHDHIFVNKLIYRLGNPKRGDIIVFKATKDADFEYGHTIENVLIKRVVGVPGDTIQVKDGKVWRNGAPLNEPPVNKDESCSSPTYCIDEPIDMQQAENARFAVNEPLKLGPGQYFVMGDNRNHSNDSRFWGPIARNRIIGKAAVVFWPVGRIRILK